MGAHATKDSSIQSVNTTGASRPRALVAAISATEFIRLSNAQHNCQFGRENEDSGGQNLCEVHLSTQGYAVKRHQPIDGGMRSGVVVVQPGIFTCRGALRRDAKPLPHRAVWGECRRTGHRAQPGTAECAQRRAGGGGTSEPQPPASRPADSARPTGTGGLTFPLPATGIDRMAHPLLADESTRERSLERGWR